jgi:nucleotide-binding universal stress UspA family protein
MYKHMLVPVDGSAPSNRALEEALKLAKAQGVRVRLVHVLEPLHNLVIEGYGDLVGAVRAEAERILAEAAARAQAAGVEASTALIEADGRRVAAAIVDEALRSGADLIVMGTHGHQGFEHLLLGSVAEGVMRRATVPVLLVRAR